MDYNHCKNQPKNSNFLDIHFDLVKEIYQPYKKPNVDPLYITEKSNHPPSILKQIPKSISKRISEISSNEPTFDQSIPYYENTIYTRYNVSLKYTPTQHLDENNGSFHYILSTLNVKTNVGKLFLKLIDRHFPRAYKFNKIFHHNTVKINYFCMKNMGSIISAYNKQSFGTR